MVAYRRIVDTWRDYCYSSRFDFINTYDILYNCHRSDILHKHINSPVASGIRFVTIFEPVYSRSLWPIEERVRAAARIARGNGGFYSYYFFRVYFSRVFRIVNPRPRRLLKFLPALFLSLFLLSLRVHCSRAILARTRGPVRP